MAKIVKTDQTSSEAVHYAFASGEFDLGGRKKFYETENLALISEAYAHPGLSVEVDKTYVSKPTFHDQLDPEDDPLSFVNSTARKTDLALLQVEEEPVDDSVREPLPTEPVVAVIDLGEKSTTDKE